MASMKGVAVDEIAKFAQLQKHWYDPHGPLRSLHLFNPMRVRYVNNMVKAYGKSTGSADSSISFLTNTGLTPQHSVLDVGCGGGIFSESLARIGGTVTGIDACKESVVVAEARRQEQLSNAKLFQTASAPVWPERLSFAHTSLFDIVEKDKKQFDVVVASEVIEHVSDARGFLEALCKATKPGGLLILSTMDKSIKTAISHILVAEYLTGIVHPGTHDWKKFIPPGDMTKFANRFDVRNVDLEYIVTYPDVFQSIASRNFQIDFCLSKSVNTGHYFWTGLKSAGTTASENSQQP